MKLYYLFSRNQKIGSKLIAWASGLLVKDLEKVPSHVAVLIEQDGFEPLVFEATLEANVRILPYRNWLLINEECYKIQCHKTRSPEEIFAKVHNLWGRKYDWAGIAFFALSFAKYILFKTRFPKDNLWQSNTKFFCNELAGEISEYGKYSMVTPAKMCSDFLKYSRAHQLTDKLS